MKAEEIVLSNSDLLPLIIGPSIDSVIFLVFVIQRVCK